MAQKKAEHKSSADNDAGKRERERLEAERRALDEEARKLAAEKVRLVREQQEASRITAERDRHVASVGERFVKWAAPSVEAVVTSVKSIGSKIGRWLRS